MNRMEIVRDYNVIATEINIIKAQTNKIMLESAIEIGKRLKEAKKIAGHGNWEKWLEEEVCYSNRTASNLMRLYDEYGSKMIRNEIGNAVADLGYTQAIAMLKLDFEERENFLIENDTTDMSVQELRDAIKEKLELKAEKEALEAKLKDIEDNESTAAIELKEKLEEIKEYDRLVKQKTNEVMKLRKTLDNMQESDVDPAEFLNLQNEVERRKDDIEERNIEIKQLKEKLKEKPKEVEVKQIAYETPPAVLKEIEDLKSKLGASESEIKFKATFELLLNRFNDLIAILDTMKETNNYEKYKNAINKLLERLVIAK